MTRGYVRIVSLVPSQAAHQKLTMVIVSSPQSLPLPPVVSMKSKRRTDKRETSGCWLDYPLVRGSNFALTNGSGKKEVLKILQWHRQSVGGETSSTAVILDGCGIACILRSNLQGFSKLSLTG